ncbi:MAG TPA: hypothetical protein IAB12_00905 [Candidatus Ornithospirochaeta avicola]|uniref:Uncharacterized protein n=1 Tax=Candidatus Ornithospirochaeta avicola TaxID=2840896 RepID=A0A9D1TMK0_9SPIO|nr:hypothetical protein [Candidatus Ornithospirochaeta avicola]
MKKGKKYTLLAMFLILLVLSMAFFVMDFVSLLRAPDFSSFISPLLLDILFIILFAEALKALVKEKEGEKEERMREYFITYLLTSLILLALLALFSSHRDILLALSAALVISRAVFFAFDKSGGETAGETDLIILPALLVILLFLILLFIFNPGVKEKEREKTETAIIETEYEKEMLSPEIVEETIIEEETKAEEAVLDTVYVSIKGISSSPELSVDESDLIDVPVPSSPSLKTHDSSLSLVDVPSKASLEVTYKYLEDVIIPSPALLSVESQILTDEVSYELSGYFADFYIAGLDSLELLDGTYYMDLYVNDTYAGNIEVISLSGNISLSKNMLEAYLTDLLTDEAYKRVLSYGEEYIPLEYFSSIGVDNSFDVDEYRIDLYFSPEDMPVQIISVRGSSSRYQRRTINDGLTLTPATFTLSSRYSLRASNSDITDNSNLLKGTRLSLGVTNSWRLFDVYGTFSYSMGYQDKDFDFAFGSYSSYYDIPEKMMRISWGNVSTDLLSAKGTALGIRVETSPSYAGRNGYRRNYYEQVIVVEKTSDVAIYNNAGGLENNEIFRRTLSPGIYRLRDFVLYSGANDILIRISPLDGSEPVEITMDVLYSSSLLAKGETYFSAALSTGRIKSTVGSQKDDIVLSIPMWNSVRYDYDIRNLSASLHFRSGITERATLDMTFALSNTPEKDNPLNLKGALSAELLHANRAGTARYNMSIRLSEKDDELAPPSLTLRFGQGFSTGLKALSSVNLSVNYYYSPTIWSVKEGHSASLSLGIGGGYGIMSWSLSSFIQSGIPDFETFTLSESFSSSFRLTSNFYLSLSLSMGVNKSGISSASGRVTASLRFGRNSINASTDAKSASANYSYYSGRHNVSASVSNWGDFDKLASYSLGANYSYSGKYVSLSSSLNTDMSLDRVALSLSLSTASVFADGLFAFTGSVPSNYILVKQKGALRGNDLFVGQMGNSSLSELPTLFNTGIYTDLSSYGDSLMVYSSSEDGYYSSNSIAVNIPESSRRGYVLRLDADLTFSLSGVVEKPSGELWINASSPLYEVVKDENGNTELVSSGNYLFTDSSGRFTVSELGKGTYAFDVDDNDEWYLYTFTVSGDDHYYGYINMLEDAEISEESVLLDIYSAVYSYEDGERFTSDEFFSFLYPDFNKEAV